MPDAEPQKPLASNEAQPAAQPAAPAGPPESVVWEGRTSQGINTGLYLLCGLVVAALVGVPLFFSLGGPILLGFAAAALIPLGFALHRVLVTRGTLYTLTTQRLRIKSGILSQRVDELELYRVKDITVLLPFHLRLCGAGTVVLNTTDSTTPMVVIRAVAGAERVKDLVREQVHRERDRKRITELDIDDSAARAAQKKAQA
ncbi:MAG: PH domain-containing protein [Planctomycetota bacterium]|nr:PH domain-containing protein [Planctomycetota bacterium]